MTAEAAGRAQLARRAGVVSAAVLASRILGLVREQVFAVSFGAGKELDAFITAFRIPNLLRDLFAEGALSAAFVTTFTQELERARRRRPPGGSPTWSSTRSAVVVGGALPPRHLASRRPSRAPSRPASPTFPARSSSRST